MVHSGAFAKFVGRVDLVIRDGELLSHDYTLFPVDGSVPSDAEVIDILEEYTEELDATFNTDQVLGYAEEKLTRYGSTGGDRVAEQMALWKKRLAPREVGDATAVGGDIGAYAGATTAADPIEELCAEDPAADECRVYDD